MAHALAVAAFITSAALTPGDPATSELEYRSFRTWKLQLPGEAFQKVSGQIPVAHAGGDGFAVEARSGGLAVDTDGDGTLDQVIEGRLDPDTQVRNAQVTLTGTGTDGEPLRYAVRLKDEGTGWTWAAGGAAVGKVGETKVTLVDLNGNGRYDDVGADAMALGSRKVAHYLSEVVQIGGELLSLEVAAAGDEITVAPYAGETGTLDFRSELQTQGKLLSAIVRSSDGRHSFDLAASSQGLTVPVGSYEVLRGELGLGKATVQVDAGAMKPLEVAASGTTVLEWGGPVRAEFEYLRRRGPGGPEPRPRVVHRRGGRAVLRLEPARQVPGVHDQGAQAGNRAFEGRLPRLLLRPRLRAGRRERAAGNRDRDRDGRQHLGLRRGSGSCPRPCRGGQRVGDRRIVCPWVGSP